MVPTLWGLVVAFDLLKLQIYQEALDTLRENARDDCISGICLAVEHAVTELCNIYDAVEIQQATVDFERIIEHALENYHTQGGWYLWPLECRYIRNRIRYLERLIEDEMSGTYFMGATIGL